MVRKIQRFLFTWDYTLIKTYILILDYISASSIRLEGPHSTHCTFNRTKMHIKPRWISLLHAWLLLTSQQGIKHGDVDIFRRLLFLFHGATKAPGCFNNAMLPIFWGQDLHDRLAGNNWEGKKRNTVHMKTIPSKLKGQKEKHKKDYWLQIKNNEEQQRTAVILIDKSTSWRLKYRF